MDRLQIFLYETLARPSEFPDDIETFNKFLEAVRQAAVTKTWSRIFEPSELWEVPKVSLLLSDTTFVYGGGGRNPTMRMFKHVSGIEQFLVSSSLAKYLEGKSISAGFFYFPREVVKQWTEDVRSLIEASRLAYLPDRVLLTKTQSASDRNSTMELLPLDPLQPWNVLYPITSPQKNSADLISRLHDLRPINALRQLLEVEVPIIREFSLNDYHRLLDDEREAVIKVRKALQGLLEQLHELSAKTDNPEEFVQRALKVRDQTIRPELAALEDQFRRITVRRSIRMSGATLATLVLSAGAIFSPQLAAYVAVLTAAGTTFKEYADYLGENGQLRDNPYHFLWQLKKKG